MKARAQRKARVQVKAQASTEARGHCGLAQAEEQVLTRSQDA